ncbi:MAG TPA: septal ring lytic transglycosylase RlpA family protein [Solirubrobacteraceae bacterium]|nr:septal ring lytic transglycosylase RlpA family protein [Solirubrobacteraceae bacterium]
MSRPHITGRVRRAHLALLAMMGLTCTAALTVAPAGRAASTTAPSLPGSVPSPGIPATPIGVPTEPFALPARLHLKLRIQRVDLNVLTGQAASVTGALRPGRAGRIVDLQRLGRRGWRTIARTGTGPRGRFVLRYTPRHLLSERVRVLFPGDAGDLRTRRNAGLLSAYRLAGASWYGGGGSLACGGQLTSSTMGVANKTLPCGTFVTLRYGGRSVRVPVVDRGPYVAGRDFDLTEATKRALGFEGVGNVWSDR